MNRFVSILNATFAHPLVSFKHADHPPQVGERSEIAAQTNMGVIGRLKVGDWVEVRPESEILRTLDSNGQLEGMPFMPEMLRFCGRKFRILKCAHKTCDGVACRARRVERTVHLDLRCSGDAHGGCQTGCLLFWKEAWLQPVNRAGTREISAERIHPEPESVFGRKDLVATTFRCQGDSIQYVCQATQIRSASTILHWWDIRQYLEDLLSRNVRPWRLICGCAVSICLAAGRAWKGFGVPLSWLFDHFHSLWKGHPFPYRTGKIPRGQRTPAAALKLRPGELVRVRSLPEIERTLDASGKNRGLYFDPEMVPYANGTFRVVQRVDRIISEETGRMLEFKTPGIQLESVVCNGHYSPCRMFCPKSSYAIWHEVWLDRVQSNKAEPEYGERRAR